MNLFIDIETIPDQRPDALARARESVKVPGNYKNPEAIDKYRDVHAVEIHAKSALKGLHGEICSIAWAIDDGEIEAATRDSSISERDILSQFFDSIRARQRGGEGRYMRLTWIGHNVLDFDLRFIKQRALVNRIQPPFPVPADARHGDIVFDTMKEWAGWRGYVKLDELCEAFGLPGKGNIDGSMVGQLWADGQFDAIRDYNKDDVDQVREVFRRMVWAA